MTVSEYKKQAEKALSDREIDTAELDVLVLLEDLLHTNRAQLLAHPERKLTPEQKKVLNLQIERRKKHEPLAYIRGKTEFYGREFIINKHVLEPRPESETMIDLLKQIVDHAQSERSDGVQGSKENRVNRIDDTKNETRTQLTQQSADSTSGVSGSARKQTGAALTIVDVGTGSGALAVTAKLEIPNATLTAIDIDEPCLNLTQQNARKHHINIHLLKNDLLKNINEHYDVLLCNLPYVPDDFAINRAATFEPKLAIFGGQDGLDLYRRLFKHVKAAKMRPRYILTEALPTQHKALAQIAKENNYRLQKTVDFIQQFAATV